MLTINVAVDDSILSIIGFSDYRGQAVNHRDEILSALREKPYQVFEIVSRVNMPDQRACQSLLMKMREEGSISFDIQNGQWLVTSQI